MPAIRNISTRKSCRFCGKTFNDRWVQMEHLIDVHAPKDPNVPGNFLCPFDSGCKEGTDERMSSDQPKANFPTHIASKHLKEKIYECSFCSATFFGASNLSKHAGRFHGVPRKRRTKSKKNKENEPSPAINNEEFNRNWLVPEPSSASTCRAQPATPNAEASISAAPGPSQPIPTKVHAYHFPSAPLHQAPASIHFWEYVSYAPYMPYNIPVAGLAPAVPAFADYAAAFIPQHPQYVPEACHYAVDPSLPYEPAYYIPFDDITNVPVVPANGPVDEWDYGTFSPEILDTPLSLLPPPGPGYPVVGDDAPATVFDESYAPPPILPDVAPPSYDYIDLDYTHRPVVASDPQLAAALDAFLELPPYSPPTSSPALPASISPTFLVASSRASSPPPPVPVDPALDAPLDFRRSASPSSSFASSTDGSDFGGSLEPLTAMPSHPVDELPLKLEDVFDDSTLGVSLGDLSTLGMF